MDTEMEDLVPLVMDELKAAMVDKFPNCSYDAQSEFSDSDASSLDPTAADSNVILTAADSNVIPTAADSNEMVMVTIPGSTQHPEAEPVFHTPPEAEPAFHTPPEAEPVFPTPTEAEPVFPTPTEAVPVFPTPTEAEPVFRTPTEAEPVFHTPTEAEPVFRTPTEAEPVFHTPTEAEPVFYTPTEPHTPSYLSSSDGKNVNDAVDGVDGHDRRNKVRVSEAVLDGVPEAKGKVRVSEAVLDGAPEAKGKGKVSEAVLDGAPEAKRIRATEENFEGVTVPVCETFPDVIIIDSDDSGDEIGNEIATVNLGEDSLDISSGGRRINLVRKNGSLVKNCRSPENFGVETAGNLDIVGALMGALKIIVGVRDGGRKEVDFIETAKRRGWKFPTPDWLPNEEFGQTDGIDLETDGKKIQETGAETAGTSNLEKPPVETACTRNLAEAFVPHLDILKKLFGPLDGKGEEVNLFETAKRRGLRFETPRWWTSEEGP